MGGGVNDQYIIIWYLTNLFLCDYLEIRMLSTQGLIESQEVDTCKFTCNIWIYFRAMYTDQWLKGPFKYKLLVTEEGGGLPNRK